MLGEKSFVWPFFCALRLGKCETFLLDWSWSLEKWFDWTNLIG
jgi:hypothetical protein